LWFSQVQVYLIRWELRIFRQLSLTAVISALVASTLSVFRTRAALQLEILALRHQLGVLQRSVKKPKLNRFDRCLWAWLFGAWAEWRSALRIGKPATVIAWHRKGFRLSWTWGVRRGPRGRPAGVEGNP
jgi:putative transposase